MRIFENEYDVHKEFSSESGRFISKQCPYSVKMSSRSYCGDWCPHFRMTDEKIILTRSGIPVDFCREN